jgi:hypothetical protein
MNMDEFKPLIVPLKESAAALIRCNPKLMDELRGAAAKNVRSLNAELVVRLAQSVVREKQEDPA